MVNIVNIVHTCLRTHCKVKEEAGSSVEFENMCMMVAFLTRHLQRGRGNHCGNEVGGDVEIIDAQCTVTYTDTQPHQHCFRQQGAVG